MSTKPTAEQLLIAYVEATNLFRNNPLQEFFDECEMLWRMMEEWVEDNGCNY